MMLHDIISYYIILYHIISYYIILYHIMSYYIILYHIYYIFYTVLCHNKVYLECIALYHFKVTVLQIIKYYPYSIIVF